jgi:hypothetical protein
LILKYKTYNRLLIFLLFLTVVDGFSTLYFVTNQYAIELNPIMAALLELGGLVFLFVKLATSFLGVFVLWLARDVYISHVFSIILAAFYTVILVFHIDIAIAVFF